MGDEATNYEEVVEVKTSLMQLLEIKYGKDIKELVGDRSMSLREVAEWLGVDPTTVMSWRTRLGI